MEVFCVCGNPTRKDRLLLKLHDHFPKVRLPLWATLLAAVLLAGAITLLALWCQPNALRSVLAVFRAQPLLIILNCLPVGMLLLAFTCLFRNVFFGAALTVAVLCCCGGLVTLFGAPESAYPYARDYLFVYGTGTLFVMLSLGLNPFITAQGRSLTSMLTVAIGAALNIALDPLFIYAFGMGVKGAAVATVISQGVSAAWAVAFFFGKRTSFRFVPAYLVPDPKTAARILFLGLSPFIMSVTESAIQIVFNINITQWSGGNSDYTAALTIMLSAVQTVCLPLNGLGSGVQPLVSYNYGAGNSARVKSTVKIITLAALCGSASVWLLSLTAPQVYGYIFSASDAVMELVVRYTPFFMMGTVMFFAQMTLQNVFIALGQAKISIFLACLRKLILLIPLCFALPYAFGVAGVFYSEGIADLTAGIITAATFFFMLPRILKKREARLAAENGISPQE